MFPIFHLAWSICRATKTFVAGWRKLLRKVERGCFEQQILTLLLVFHQTHNLSRNKFARALANQPISALHFFNPQQMFLLLVKLITQGEKRKTSTKTCKETMLRVKLRVFVSRISPPLWIKKTETYIWNKTLIRRIVKNYQKPSECHAEDMIEVKWNKNVCNLPSIKFLLTGFY